jgi:hypothetical protein
MRTVQFGLLCAAAALFAGSARAGDGMDCPMHAAHTHSKDASHHSGVEERGDAAMGFDHARTTHHFLLTKSGGVIRVEANDSTDSESRDQIRMHLTHIARLFSEGNFQVPMFVHDRVPPGVPTLEKRRELVRYQYAEREKGAEVRIETSDEQALSAVHEFLRFQIRDHETGDPLEVSESPSTSEKN